MKKLLIYNKSGRTDLVKFGAIVFAIYFIFFFNGGMINPTSQEPQTPTILDICTTPSTADVTCNPNSQIDSHLSYFNNNSTTVVVGDIDNTLELTKYTI